MAWMPDEQYELMRDTREKAITARSARHTRTHCGKGGAVKFPSDYLSKKELKAMNGECKSYRLNAPMSWEEFKGMPDDLKISYIQALRTKYNVPDNELADMMGVNRVVLCKYLKCLNLSKGRGRSVGGSRNWDREGFLAWRGLAPKAVDTDEIPVEEVVKDTDEIPVEEVAKDVVGVDGYDYVDNLLGDSDNNSVEGESCECCGETKILVPMYGEMMFEGDAYDILRSLDKVLNGAYVRLTVKWDVLEE